MCSDRPETWPAVRPTSTAEAARRCLAAGVGLALVACGGQAFEALPTRPAAPADWTEVSEDRGEVRLLLPSDFEPVFTDGTVLANTPTNPAGTMWWEVRATGPSSVLPQPGPNQSLTDWLKQRLEDEFPAAGPGATALVGLPAGRAVRLRTTVDANTPNPTVVVGYAIQTSDGVGFMYMIGPAAHFDERAQELELVAMLLEFAAPSSNRP